MLNLSQKLYSVMSKGLSINTSGSGLMNEEKDCYKDYRDPTDMYHLSRRKSPFQGREQSSLMELYRSLDLRNSIVLSEDPLKISSSWKNY